MLTREQIDQAVADRQRDTTGTLDLPEWGGKVGVRLVSGSDLKDMGFYDLQRADDPAEAAQYMPRLLAGLIGDDDGQRVYDPEDEDDLAFLGKVDFRVQMKLLNKFIEVNGLDDATREAKATAFAGAQDEDDSSD